MSTHAMHLRSFRRPLTLALAATLLSGHFAPAFSQRPDEQDETVRVSSNLVQVDAVVLDNRGRQVTNLKATDFEIVEEGRVRQPKHCTYIPVAGTPGEASPPADGRLAPNEVRRSIIFVVGDISLGGLPPGRYTLEVAITDLNSRTARVVTSSDFQITK